MKWRFSYLVVAVAMRPDVERLQELQRKRRSVNIGPSLNFSFWPFLERKRSSFLIFIWYPCCVHSVQFSLFAVWSLSTPFSHQNVLRPFRSFRTNTSIPSSATTLPFEVPTRVKKENFGHSIDRVNSPLLRNHGSVKISYHARYPPVSRRYLQPFCP